MLKISWIELIIKGIPEGFLDVLAIFFFIRMKFDLVKYFILSVGFIFLNYIIRLLPISFGVNTMLGLLALILLFIIICKAEPSKVIKSVIIMAIFLFISEGINSVILILMFGTEKTMSFVSDPITKSISSIPSTVIFAVIVICSYFVLKKRDEHKKVKNGNVSKEPSDEASE